MPKYPLVQAKLWGAIIVAVCVIIILPLSLLVIVSWAWLALYGMEPLLVCDTVTYNMWMIACIIFWFNFVVVVVFKRLHNHVD